MAAVPSPVLLTGATGFIGRHLHVHLLDRGIAVRALVRPASAARAALDPRCEVVAGELTDPVAWSRALDGAGAVVYGAGAVRGRDYQDFVPANVAGVAIMAAVMAELAAPPPVVLLSSLAASRPYLSHYAGSKRAGERALTDSALARWTVLRPPAVYGPGDEEMRPLFDLVRRGIALRPGPPGQRLSLLHVDDLVRAVAAALAATEACRGQTFAIDDGKPGGYDWGEIARDVAGRPVRELGVPFRLLRGLGALNLACARLFRYAPMLSPGKALELHEANWLCDNRAFTHATGWRPEVDLEHGAAALYS